MGSSFTSHAIDQTQRPQLELLLPEYELMDEVGRGASGVVIRAQHRLLGRTVAVKQLRADLVEEEMRKRFMVEARVLARLDHPHIVPIYDFKETNGTAVLVMEQLAGGTVWERLQTGAYTPQEACALILAACSALQYAHDRGVLHRDIKPENLIYNEYGVVKITDFGIAKVMETTSARTRTGDYFGTPAYMAPEQAQGARPAPTVDIYALGTLLYELLSGDLPFPGEKEALALIFRRVHGNPTPLHETAPGVDPGVEAVTMKALSRFPDDRYQSATEFAAAVRQAAEAAWGPGWLEESTSGGPSGVASPERNIAIRGHKRMFKKWRVVKVVSLAVAFATIALTAYASGMDRTAQQPVPIVRKATHHVIPTPAAPSAPVAEPDPLPPASTPPDAAPAPAQVAQINGGTRTQSTPAPAPLAPSSSKSRSKAPSNAGEGKAKKG